jgi:hypothetical protein
MILQLIFNFYKAKNWFIQRALLLLLLPQALLLILAIIDILYLITLNLTEKIKLQQRFIIF